MTPITPADGAEVAGRRVSAQDTGNGDADGASAASHYLMVLPHERRAGFWANIGGHVLDLADPGAGHPGAPTPDDLLVVSIASELAWSARGLLRANGVPDDVSVSATWRTPADPSALTDINLTVTVPSRAEPLTAALAASFEKRLAARSLAKPVVQVSLEGAKR